MLQLLDLEADAVNGFPENVLKKLEGPNDTGCPGGIGSRRCQMTTSLATFFFPGFLVTFWHKKVGMEF